MNIPQHARVVIIGGGISGCSVAYHLAKLGWKDIVPNVNWFMSVPVGSDGSAAIALGASKPGARVDLRADRDVIAVLSNCPQVLNPANAFNPTPIRVTVRTTSP